MNLHEYQAKQLFANAAIPVPAGGPAHSVDEALAVARKLGGKSWMVKAQVHAGARGKAGGIKKVSGLDELAAATKALLGTRLVTHQTSETGLPVKVVLIEPAQTIQRELYLGILVDRSREHIVIMASAAGGVSIEEVAATEPEKIHTVYVNPVAGLQPFQCRQLAFGLGLEVAQINPFTQLAQGLYRLFIDRDVSLAEINPLIVTADGGLLALDAKVVVDDNALYRQPEMAKWRDASQEDARENEARQHGLNYITLDGNIACMVNGAGLAMATMDLIKLHGGEPANFLDVGGTATAERVTEAFKLILSDKKVRAILVNIFGGIVRCDLIAEGIIKAVEEIDVAVPVIVRLEGTRVDEGKRLLRDSGLAVVAAEGLTDAAQKAVMLAAKGAV